VTKEMRMSWIDRMEMAYEAQTARMIDDMYAPVPCECSWCDEYFDEDNVVESDLSDTVQFCSEDCLENWEEENKHDYEEEE
jgi:hypothetical protein